MGTPADILVIDDDPVIRETLGDVLREQGHHVDRVGRGEAALERILLPRPVDVAIVDCRLPDISGLELLRRIKVCSPETKVIVMTGHASLDGALEAMAGDASSYLVKPVATAQLLSTVDRALTRQALLRALRDFEGSKHELVESERLRAVCSLTDGVTDYVRQVLQKILGQVQVVLPQLEGTDGHGKLAGIKATVMEAADVLKRLQVAAEVRTVSEAPPLDLNDVARAAIGAVRLAGAGVAPRVDIELAPGPLPSVAGEASGLLDVLTAVLANAVEALPGGGTVKVRTWASGLHVHCAVEDPGAGMTPATRERALEPFFTTKAGQHKGLGLSVAHGVLRKHGGDIRITSERGEGTVVTLRLPARPATSA
jgi:signal transduction histidine kinase